MPYDDPDPTDPQELIGVMLPAEPASMLEMAYAFSEEFARLGHGREQILRLFHNPFYAGAHGALQAIGTEAIEKVVDECVAVFGRVQLLDRDA